MFHKISEAFMAILASVPALFTEPGSPNFMLVRAMLGLIDDRADRLSDCDAPVSVSDCIVRAKSIAFFWTKVVNADIAIWRAVGFAIDDARDWKELAAPTAD